MCSKCMKEHSKWILYLNTGTILIANFLAVNVNTMDNWVSAPALKKNIGNNLD